MSITFATSRHLLEINRIYNQAVDDGLRTAHIHHYSMEERKSWFSEHSKEWFPVYVYLRDGEVLGWVSISSYRSDRQALNEVVEVSYYVHYGFHRQGIGTKLLEQAVSFCRNHHYRIMVAILVSDNMASIALLKKFGFQEVGRIPEAFHYKKDFYDHLFMSKNISS